MPVTVEASFSWIPLGLVLAPPDGALGEVDELDEIAGIGDVTTPAAVVPAGTIGPRPVTQVVDVDGDAPSTLVLAVPAGKGWTAVADGRELPSLTVDGWAQGGRCPRAPTG